MWIRTLFAPLTRRASLPPVRPARPGAARGRLSVEPLDDRLVPAAWFSVGDVTVLEGNEGTRYAVVPVTLSGEHGNNVSVEYGTADGAARAGSDYDAVSGKLTFTKSESSKSILVPIRGDRVGESAESFSVRLFNVKEAKIADGTGVVTITDDEPRISISGGSALEGNSGTTPLTFTVSLSAAYDQAVTVNFATQDGTAIAGEDYLATSGTLTFAPGETTKTITVEVLGDTTPEPDETFYVHLSGASANALIINGYGYGTILDDDGWIPPPPPPDDGGCTPDNPQYPNC